jgi:hypothetical protein
VRGSNGRRFGVFREFVRRQDATGNSRRRRRPARFYTYAKLYGRMTPQRRSEIVEVKAHHRHINLKARPFMGGSAWSRLQATFEQRMGEAMAVAIRLSEKAKAADAASAAAAENDTRSWE